MEVLFQNLISVNFAEVRIIYVKTSTLGLRIKLFYRHTLLIKGVEVYHSLLFCSLSAYDDELRVLVVKDVLNAQVIKFKKLLVEVSEGIS